MGIRLYPSGTFDEELLACVPKGTAARLNKYYTLRPTDYGGQPLTEWYEKLQADTFCETLDNFRLFGWGRINNYVTDWIKVHDLDLNNGEVTGHDSEVLLTLQAVSVTNGVTAVHWE